jgi:hypothetical protein
VIQHDTMLVAQRNARETTTFFRLDDAIQVGETLGLYVGHGCSLLAKTGGSAVASLSRQRLKI